MPLSQGLADVSSCNERVEPMNGMTFGGGVHVTLTRVRPEIRSFQLSRRCGECL